VPEKELQRKPLDVLEKLKIILGEGGYNLLETPIKDEIIKAFKIKNADKQMDFDRVIRLARKNYLLT
jgi:uncharacterized membrane protein